jgi:hypothetical protein
MDARCARDGEYRGSLVELERRSNASACCSTTTRTAAALCLDYATGGGREAAAGINHLPLESVGAFTDRFLMHFAKD